MKTKLTNLLFSLALFATINAFASISIAQQAREPGLKSKVSQCESLEVKTQYNSQMKAQVSRGAVSLLKM
jgi:hypothetical protein